MKISLTKKIFFFICLFISTQYSFAQNFAWAQHFGGNIWDYGKATATDPDGNVFVTGYFRNTMDADPGPAIVNLVSEGSRDIYVSKFNASGSLIWAKQISGASDEVANDIAIDAAGNVYITGTYFDSVDFNPGLATFYLPSSNFGQTYICKLDTDGNFIFAKGFSGDASSSIAITIDANENIYTTGNFSGLTDFDPESGILNLDAAGVSDMFVCKLNASGALVWAKQIGEVSDSLSIKIKGIAVDINGNVYTTGRYIGTVDFDSGSGIFNLVSSLSGGVIDYDIFISKLDANGNFVLAKSIGGESYEEATGIAVDENENIYTIGYFSGAMDFDPGVADSIINSSGIGTNGYLTKFDINGDLVWAKAYLGMSGLNIQSIALDPDNNIYTSGNFSGTFDFDLGTNQYLITSTGGSDIFVSKNDVNGNFIWAQKVGGLADESALDMAIDSTTNNVFVTGYFTDSSDFDYSSETWNMTSNGEWDVFLVKLSECVPNNGITDTVETCNQYTWAENGGVYNESGSYWNILTSSSGCDSTVKLNLTLTEFDNVISMNLFGSLVANPSAFIDEYKWVDCQTFTVLGTQGSYLVTSNGSYALISTSGNCIDTSNCVVVTELGINELETSGFSIYPNPVHDQLTLKNDNTSESFEVEVTSTYGQQIYAGSHKNGDIMPASKWASGIYLVKIISGSKLIVSQIIKL